MTIAEFFHGLAEHRIEISDTSSRVPGNSRSIGDRLHIDAATPHPVPLDELQSIGEVLSRSRQGRLYRGQNQRCCSHRRCRE